MLWRKQIDPDLPWYRRPDYKGSMTEANKRKLDAIRDQEVHPATKWDDVPEDVQSYISRLEVEIYDYKQGQAFAGPAVTSVVGVCLVALMYFGFEPTSEPWRYLLGLALIVVPWFFYKRTWKANAEEFLPSGDRPASRAEEQIRQEWELDYLSRLRRSDDS